MSYHKTLERQLRKVFGKGNDIPENILPLLDLVSRTYEQYDDEKDLLNNTMDVGLLELTESNAALLNQKIALEKAYLELAETQTKLSEAEQITALMREVGEKNAQLISNEEELKQNLEEVTLLKEAIESSHWELEKILKNVTDSINYAKRIQKAIIPREVELKKHLDCFVFFRPKDIVSGDFYWFADKGDKKIIAVADCTGHGVSGAFMTMIGNNILNQIVHNHEFHNPDEILNIMPILLQKTLLHSESKIRDGMDIGIITIYLEEEKTSRVEYAGAKTPLYYVQNNEFKEIKADRVPIGGIVKEDFSYQKHELIFEKNLADFENPQGLTVYLFSDGYQDQFGGDKNRKFMSANFKNLLSLMENRPMEEQKQLLIEGFETWKGENKQTDDVLVVGVRV